MYMGFNSKNNNLPITLLTKMLLHNYDKETIKECKHYGLTVMDDKVELSKSSFNNEQDEVKIIHSCISKFLKVIDIKYLGIKIMNRFNVFNVFSPVLHVYY